MAKITRVIQKIFGVNAGIDERAQIGSIASGSPVFTTDPVAMQALANYEEGLFGTCIGENSPAIEDINSIYNLITRQLAYIFQQGVAEYDATTEYHLGSVVNLDGVFYSSLINTNLGNPLTDITKWKLQGNNFNANLINGKVVPVYPATNPAFVKNAAFVSTPAIANVRVSRDNKLMMYVDDASGAGLKIIDFNSKKINTTSAATISAQPAGVAGALSESPDEKFLAVASDATPYVHFYERIGTAFTKLANPASLPAVASNYSDSVAWSRDGNLVAFSGNNSMKLAIYRKDGRSFVKVADPATMPTSSTRGVKFSPDGNFLTLFDGISPATFRVYKITYDAAGLPVFTYVANAITWSISNMEFYDWHPDSSCIIFADTPARVFTINSSTGVLTEVVQTSLPLISAQYYLNIKMGPDGKAIYALSNTAGGVGTGITVLSLNTVSKQMSVVGTFKTTGASTSDTYVPYLTPNNKHLVVARFSGSGTNLEMFENPEVIDLNNKTPRILYKLGADQ